MIDPENGRKPDVEALEDELRQFERLIEANPTMSDEELAHRMVWTKAQARRARKLLEVRK